jgi:hypothetical protein
MLHSCCNVSDRPKVFKACRHYLVPAFLGVAIVAKVLATIRLLDSVSE